MSRLNDALKRASQTDRSRQRPSPTRARVAPLAGPRGKSLAVAMGAGSILALGLAVWFFWQFWAAGREPAATKVDAVSVVTPTTVSAPVIREEIPARLTVAPQPVIRAEIPPPATIVQSPPVAVPTPAAAPSPAPPPTVASRPAPDLTPLPAPTPVAVPPPAPVPALAAAPAPAPAPVAPAKPVEPSWPADLKVMGNLFRKTNPLALISGKTVGEGDEIDSIRVTKIENDRVTVEWNGKTKELVLKARRH